MTRLRRALEELNSKGYKIDTLKELCGGINSAVFQAKALTGKHYALKLYPLITKHDRRNRCITETKFLNYLKVCKCEKAPVLEESNSKTGWALMSWIEGRKPKKLETSDLEEITEFIYTINSSSAKHARSELQPASEACQSLTKMIDSIDERIKRIEASNAKTNEDQRTVKWIASVLRPYFQETSNNILFRRTDSTHWKDIQYCSIASPSDMGIHNTLRTKHGLHFIDFEYAGLDDLSKLAADWILQPEQCLNHEQEEKFVNLLRTRMKNYIGVSWQDRLQDIKPLIHIKWCLIMLNKSKYTEHDGKQLEKAIRYFESKYIVNGEY